MRITELKPLPAKQKRWLVTLENGGTIRVTEAEMADFSLYTGMELDETALSALKKAAAAGNLRGRALDLVSARSCSRAELLRKLGDRGYGEDEAASAADWLERIGLLNDAEYARAVVRHCAEKGYGIYRAKDALYRRGVPKELWEEALAGLPDPAQVIDAFVRRSLDEDAGRDRIKKCYDALLRRGFKHGDIGDALRRYGVET